MAALLNSRFVVFQISIFLSLAFTQALLNESFPNQPSFTTNLTTVNIWYNPPQFRANGSLEDTHYIVPRQKHITYEDVNGLAVVEGDIILGTVADVQAAIVGPNYRVRPRGMSIQYTNKLNKWTNGIVYYKYESLEFENKRKQQFEAAIKLWSDRLPFLTFQKEPASADRVADGGAITLIPGPLGGTTSYSPLGRAGWVVAGVFQYQAEHNVMTLAQCNASLPACAVHYAHEIGHTLGLHHEHNRPDRDTNVAIHCERIPGYIGASAEVQEALCSAYVKEDPVNVDFSGPYDRDSVMHYGTGLGFGIDGQKIMEGRPPFPDPNPGYAPTKYDILKVCNLYSEVCTAICGDGILSPGEICNDGNNVDNDGCAANCKSTTNILCGNGILDDGEQCDLGTNNGAPGSKCDFDCKEVTIGGIPGSCGIQTCNPTPGENKCHITSSCIPIDGSPTSPRHLCACPHGFRGLNVPPGDLTSQVRIPESNWPTQKGRVFVNPGTECSQLCNAWTLGADGCTEVGEVISCF